MPKLSGYNDDAIKHEACLEYEHNIRIRSRRKSRKVVKP